MATLSRRTSYYLRRLLRRVIRTNASSRQIAGGVAVGVLIAFTPTMGLQVVLAALLTTLLRCSRLPAIAAVYVTNPFTFIPVYVFCYVVGAGLLRPFGFTLDVERINALLIGPEGAGVLETIYDRLLEVSALGWEFLAPLWLGCLVVGAGAAVVAYHVSLRFVTGHRLIKAEHMARRAQRRLERVQREQAIERARTEGSAGHE